MAGHSKWAGIKHKKAIVDAQKGQRFSKLIRELTVAARQGGDPEANPRLRLAMTKAREANMAKDKIEQAVKRGTGEIPGVTYDEMPYEGYGPGGVAILVKALTDNKNRTTSEVRNLFVNHHGNLAGTGSVAWLFQQQGYILVPRTAVTEDRVMEVVLDAGGEDVAIEGESLAVTTPLAAFDRVKQALAEAQIPMESAEVTMVPSNTVRVEGPKAKQLLELLEALEAHDDVQHVYANFDIPEELLQAAAKG